jgi:hypothetical protein
VQYFTTCLGGVAQWTSRQPEEQKIRVRFPPGDKFLGIDNNVVVKID